MMNGLKLCGMVVTCVTDGGTRHCLSTEFQTMADLSCIDETTKFLCPACPVEKLYVVCFVQGENVIDFI